MGATFPNGRIPNDRLVRLDTGGGRHLLTYAVAARWYMLRRDVFAETGVTLYITPGMNGYRDWDEQGVGRVNACAAGNCAAAASQGSSSHGGNCAYSFTDYKRVDAMAIDVGNYWQVPWATFKRLAEKWGFGVGLITKEIAGIHEPWHIINFDPYGLPPLGIRLTRGADGVWRLDEASLGLNSPIPLDPQEDTVGNPIVNVTDGSAAGAENGSIYIGMDDGTFRKYEDSLADAKEPGYPNARGVIRKVFFDGEGIPEVLEQDFPLVRHMWATMKRGGKPADVWEHPIRTQTPDGNHREEHYPAHGFMASTNAQVNAVAKTVDLRGRTDSELADLIARATAERTSRKR